VVSRGQLSRDLSVTGFDDIVLGEDRCGAFAPRKNPPCRGISAGEGKIAALKAHPGKIETRFAECLPVTFKPRLAGMVGRIPHDHRESAMAEADHMFGNLAGCCDIIDGRAGASIGFKVRRDPGIGNARRIEPVENREQIAARRCEHQSVDRGRTRERN